MSWNGATDVTRWRLLVGEANDDLMAIRTVPKTGFEANIPIDAKGAYVAVQALDRHGAIVGTSTTVRR